MGMTCLLRPSWAEPSVVEAPGGPVHDLPLDGLEQTALTLAETGRLPRF